MCVWVLCVYVCVEAWSWLQDLSSLALYLISIETRFPLNPEFTVFATPVSQFAVMTPVSASCMLGLQTSFHILSALMQVLVVGILASHLLALYLLLSLPRPLPFHLHCKLKEQVWLALSSPPFFRLLSGVLRVLPWKVCCIFLHQETGPWPGELSTEFYSVFLSYSSYLSGYVTSYLGKIWAKDVIEWLWVSLS